MSKKKKPTSKKEELEGRLRAVDTANALMDIFGFKMNEESEEKVKSWVEEFKKLKD